MSSRRHAGSAYVVAPETGHGPGVLVLHPWWGLTPFVRRWCDRLADAGFTALAPDLFAGGSADRPDEAEELLAAMDVDAAADLVLSSVGTLRRLPVTDDHPIGIVGFSMGASWGLWAAARVADDVAAVVTYYGTQGTALDGATAAFLGHFASHDELVSDDEVVELEAHLRLLGLDVTFHRYAGTGHWFVEDDRPAAFDAGAATLAWDRTLGFLEAHLRPDAT
jgi:carboxymethylenebutenolidase